MVARKQLQASIWTNLGSEDPDWAVLSAPEMRGGKWLAELERFYADGRARVAEALRAMPPDQPRRKALDFGSGTGRLTFALAELFTEVTAADVSPSMLGTLMDRGHERRLSNILPVNLQLETLDHDHDFALSIEVLQHLETRVALDEALGAISAALVPGGGFYLEAPDKALGWRAKLQPRYRLFRFAQLMGVSPTFLSRHGLSGMSMICISQERFTEMARKRDLVVLGCRSRVSSSYHVVVYVGQRRESTGG